MSGIESAVATIEPEDCSAGACDSMAAVRPTVVLKFGGSAVGTPGRLRRAAKRVRGHVRAGARVVVVVSATGDSTDRIARWCRAVAPACGARGSREMDRALATGEDFSAALLAAALLDLGVEAVSLRGGEAGLEASGSAGAGEIQHLRGERLRSLLEQGVVPVVAGFQALRPDGETITLGRGGSDTTAAYLAGALGAAACHIITDVDGVYDRDPQLDPSARHLPSVPYETLIRLAEAGAQVVHPAAAGHARRFETPLHVYSFRAPLEPERATYVGPAPAPAIAAGKS